MVKKNIDPKAELDWKPGIEVEDGEVAPVALHGDRAAANDCAVGARMEGSPFYVIGLLEGRICTALDALDNEGDADRAKRNLRLALAALGEWTGRRYAETGVRNEKNGKAVIGAEVYKRKMGDLAWAMTSR